MIITIYLFALGAVFGSFVNAFSWRLHNRLEAKEGSPKMPTSVLSGRSICESCGHELSVLDLIPIFSWIFLRGKCRYCKKPIHWQNPVVEIGTSLAFGLSYIYWPLELDSFGWISLIVWLAMVVTLANLIVYDIKWLMLPNALVYPLIIAALAIVGIEAIFFDGGADLIRESVLGLFILGGFFYALFQVSSGRWIGGGDVKLAFFMGIYLLLGRGVVGLYTGFVLASLVILPLLIMKKIGRKQPVPFGPFLIVGTFVAQLWGQNIIDWYSDTFLYGLY